MKEKTTGFHEAIHYGESGQQYLLFEIKQADGRLHPAIQIRCKTRKELAKILIKFRQARRKVPASSRGLFGGNFAKGTLKYVACHSGRIRDFTKSKIKIIEFKSPCIRKILNNCE